MRRSTRYGVLMTCLVTAVLAIAVHSRNTATRDLPVLRETSALAGRMGATDLCLFTEARYSRHPSQSDLHTPFQDHPHSLEHFPSGSLLAPVRRPGEP